MSVFLNQPTIGVYRCSALRVAVIGLGVGERHLAALSQNRRCEVISVCDWNVDKLNRVESSLPGLICTTNASDVISDDRVEMVSIATYDDTHSELVMSAIDAGKHVFVEKPLCLTASEFSDIKSLLEKKPSISLSSNFVLRSVPRFTDLKDNLRKNLLGDIYYVEGDYNYGRLEKILTGWRSTILNYSVMHGGGMHLIDLLCWVLNDRVREVFAIGNKKCTMGSTFKGCDLVASLLTFESGVIGKVTANFGSVTPHYHGVAVFGNAGTFQQSLAGAAYSFVRNSHEGVEAAEVDYPGHNKSEIINSFVRHILDGDDPDVRQTEVLHAMAVSLAIERSIKTGKSELVDCL